MQHPDPAPLPRGTRALSALIRADQRFRYMAMALLLSLGLCGCGGIPGYGSPGPLSGNGSGAEGRVIPITPELIRAQAVKRTTGIPADVQAPSPAWPSTHIWHPSMTRQLHVAMPLIGRSSAASRPFTLLQSVRGSSRLSGDICSRSWLSVAQRSSRNGSTWSSLPAIHCFGGGRDQWHHGSGRMAPSNSFHADAASRLGSVQASGRWSQQ